MANLNYTIHIRADSVTEKTINHYIKKALITKTQSINIDTGINLTKGMVYGYSTGYATSFNSEGMMV